MAAATTDTQIFQNLENNNENSNNDVRRQEIQAAIAKAVELRALHAALMHGNSPANRKFRSSSPVSLLFLSFLLKITLFSLLKLPQGGKPNDGNGENSMPVSEEVMVEGFLQIVSEARLSVKQFCKTLVGQIGETDGTLMDNLNLLLQPYKLSLNSRYSKAVLYHLEAIINQSLYQDFENRVFQKNGSPLHLDPQQDRQAQFASFVALRNLSWNEVSRKGTKYYSEEFSKFCDQKMGCIITTLNWTRPWPEQLLQAFFVAAKCIWLLHLLAFSFNPPLGILRVEENRSFDPHYMEDMFMDRQRSHGPSRVKIMVKPGFYVQDRVLMCKVLCRYKSAA
ncbi:hypothetical protein GH714_039663 [Hevea brasiliensis]|uniref:IRK-interacting protein n=1 Tax=Hevea brasiliensis TaxID=3981 RepID=A0A6A6MW15_HEVBR|nr:hypothetical protein GH714_039663 [Hevea brasiliensis]